MRFAEMAYVSEHEMMGRSGATQGSARQLETMKMMKNVIASEDATSTT